MPVFLTDKEREAVWSNVKKDPVSSFFWNLMRRADKRAAEPGLHSIGDTTEWWHLAAEYVMDVAMAYALKPAEDTGIWLRDVTLSLARRSTDDWVGPWFRCHTANPPIGHLETAHLSWAVSLTYDLAGDVFNEAEKLEVEQCLRDKAIPLCRQFLKHSTTYANWRAVLLAGMAMPAAVLGDAEALAEVEKEFILLTDLFEDDGSYAESLQYSNYAAYTMMLTYESLIRARTELEGVLDPGTYPKLPVWCAYSYFYKKSMKKWPSEHVPRSANFNDSAAVFGGDPDLLLHIAVRFADKYPTEAKLSRWMFDELYPEATDLGPLDLTTFKFVNRFGFLTLPMLAQAGEGKSPAELDLPTMKAFDCGNVLVRPSWDSKTVLAVDGGTPELKAPGHLHGGVNGFILVHNKERLLVDPGHTCYRNLSRGLEISSDAHSTCSFSFPGAEQGQISHILQVREAVDGYYKRTIKDGVVGPNTRWGAETFIAEQAGNVNIVASECAGLYGKPIERFARFWFLCGEHALFVVDHVKSSAPVKTTFNWMFNNRDGNLDIKNVGQDRMVIRRGNAGMKMFNCTNQAKQGPVYACVHDSYHPLPNQFSEGQPGSGMLYKWQDKEAKKENIALHAMAVDSPGEVAQWHLYSEDGSFGLEKEDEHWWLSYNDDVTEFTITNKVTGETHTVKQQDNGWKVS